MEEYTEIFRRAGYSKEEDVENLKELDEKAMNKMGVVKMGKVYIIIIACMTPNTIALMHVHMQTVGNVI